MLNELNSIVAQMDQLLEEQRLKSPWMLLDELNKIIYREMEGEENG